MAKYAKLIREVPTDPQGPCFSTCARARTGTDEKTLRCGWQTRCGRVRMRKSCFAVVNIFLTSSPYIFFFNTLSVFCKTRYSTTQRRICRYCAQIDIFYVSTEKRILRKFVSACSIVTSVRKETICNGKANMHSKPAWGCSDINFLFLLHLHKTIVAILYVRIIICVLSHVQSVDQCRWLVQAVTFTLRDYKRSVTTISTNDQKSISAIFRQKLKSA